MICIVRFLPFGSMILSFRKYALPALSRLRWVLAQSGSYVWIQSNEMDSSNSDVVSSLLRHPHANNSTATTYDLPDFPVSLFP